MPIAGGELRNVTPGFKGSFNSLQRRAGKLYATAVVFDRFTLFAMEKNGHLKSLWSDQNTILAGDGRVSLSADGSRMATTQQSFTTAPRIVVGRLNNLHPNTHENDGLVANADARSISYMNEGFTIQGWLLAPKNLQPGNQSHPAVYVHGGRAHFQERASTWMTTGTTSSSTATSCSCRTFAAASVRAWPTSALRSWILAAATCGTSWRESTRSKRSRPSTTSGSLSSAATPHGGFMVQWASTQTDRFKAAAASTTLTNWLSDYGTEGINKWMAPYFRGMTPYERPDIFDRISPDRFVKQVKTPTLIFNGGSDVEAPVEQSIEWWIALKAVGVPTSLVIYPGEGHKYSNPASERDAAARLVAWFNKYVGEGPK